MYEFALLWLIVDVKSENSFRVFCKLARDASNNEQTSEWSFFAASRRDVPPNVSAPLDF